MDGLARATMFDILSDVYAGTIDQRDERENAAVIAFARHVAELLFAACPEKAAFDSLESRLGD